MARNLVGWGVKVRLEVGDFSLVRKLVGNAPRERCRETESGAERKRRKKETQ